MRLTKLAAFTSAALLLTLGTAPQAAAMTPPVYNPATDIPPGDGVPGPPDAMQQRRMCETSLVLKGTQLTNPPAGLAFGVEYLHKFATGAGQTVAVIDSGVKPNVRLPHLTGGGDYIITDENGLNDCDHHGTLVAGIIGAAPSPRDQFVGVAPDAEIISIRQTSGAYEPEHPDFGRDREGAAAASTVDTLARAIVHAANLGATVINISVTACIKVNTPASLGALAGALHYAAVDRNVVIVAAAGNTNSNSSASTKCEKNPPPPVDDPTDARGWSVVQMLSLPSLYSQYVLSVGGSGETGDPYGATMTGPWVGVAAPAINIVSLDPEGGDRGTLVNGQMADNKPTPLNGTSFSAAYVSGLAALIRQKYPNLSAAQVIRRILYTAHSPANNISGMVGFGVVDAYAALTARVSVGEWHPPSAASSKLPVAPPPPREDHTDRNIGLAVAGAAALMVALVSLAGFVRRSQ